jgi:hypothetical protein
LGNTTSLGKKSAYPLTIDPNAQLGVSSQLLGFDGEDHMSFQHIFQHYYAYLSVDMNPSTVLADDIILSVEVAPNACRRIGTEVILSTPAYLAQFFKFWTGDLEYRFVVTRSGTQNGVLKIVYDPYRFNLSQHNTNTNHVALLDLAETTDFSLIVPYEAPELYKKTTDMVAFPRATVGAALTPIARDSNGVLVVMADTTLTTAKPGAIDDLINIAVYVRPVASAFTFMGPQISTTMKNATASFEGTAMGEGERGGSMYQSTHTAYTSDTTGIPQNLPIACGTEVFFTVRDIVARQCPVEHIKFTGPATGTVSRVVRNQFPPFPGIWSNGGHNPDAWYGPMNPLAAMSMMYAWRRGGVNWTFIPWSNQSDQAIYTVNRVDQQANERVDTAILGSDQSINTSVRLDLCEHFSGAIMAQSSTNEALAWRCHDTHAKLATYNRLGPGDFENFDQSQGFAISRFGTFGGGTQAILSAGASDDLSFMGFVGPPIMHIDFIVV